jgi:hypothetical protein
MTSESINIQLTRKLLIGAGRSLMQTIIVITIIVFSVCIYSCTDSRQKIGEKIIAKIEAYKKTNGHVPERLEDIGIETKMEGPIYYVRTGDTTYFVYYGGRLGESIIYNFKTKKWESDRGD